MTRVKGIDMDNYKKLRHVIKYLVPRLARAVTWPVPAPVARGHHGPSNTATCPIRWLRYPEMMAMEYGGGGEDTDRDRIHQSSQQDGRVQRGRGARSDHKSTVPLGGRVEGQVWLYKERV